MKNRQNHGLKGLTDATDGAEHEPGESVQSHNPWQSVIQTPPPGYKQTEIGVIPDDWEIKRLEEIASVSSGGTPSRHNQADWGGDIPWITTTHTD